MTQIENIMPCIETVALIFAVSQLLELGNIGLIYVI